MSTPRDSEEDRTPRQRATLERLGAPRSARPEFPADLAPRLHAALEDELAPVVAALGDDERIFVSKHALATVHACEARWHAESLDSTFTPSPPVVQGSVAHKAIELSLNRRAPGTPGELVDAALARLADSDAWMAEWLRTCDEDDRAEVRAGAVGRVSAFADIWPPLPPRWRPVTEARLRAELASGAVVLQGRADLTLGAPEGQVAGRVIVDFKTGGFTVSHRDDLRFYALVETLRTGVPPRLLATSYLDSGDLHTEAVTEGTLDAAAARTVDGISRMVAVAHAGEVPTRRPSGACRWCAERDTCGPGRDHLAGTAPDAAGGPDRDEE